MNHSAIYMQRLAWFAVAIQGLYGSIMDLFADDVGAASAVSLRPSLLGIAARRIGDLCQRDRHTLGTISDGPFADQACT